MGWRPTQLKIVTLDLLWKTFADTVLIDGSSSFSSSPVDFVHPANIHQSASSRKVLQKLQKYNGDQYRQSLPSAILTLLLRVEAPALPCDRGGDCPPNGHLHFFCTMMVNLCTHVARPCSVRYLIKRYSRCSCEGVLDEIKSASSEESRLPPECGWTSSNQLKA